MTPTIRPPGDYQIPRITVNMKYLGESAAMNLIFHVFIQIPSFVDTPRMCILVTPMRTMGLRHSHSTSYLYNETVD